MIAAARPILDEYGAPIERKVNRLELAESLANVLPKRRNIEARYDAAATNDDNKNYWVNADDYDADSANSYAVRRDLVRRSRYETYNNGWSDGIAQTYADDLIGRGPQLRMQTGSEGFNRMVELSFFEWAKEVKLRRKLKCLAHAKHMDGEGLAVLRTNRRIKHPVKLDIVLHETEQCHTPMLPYNEKGYIDGIKFDEFGNPLWYDILKQHPGATGYATLDLVPERVPEKFVAHWFKLRRPGQHRGIPECTSTLPVGAAARRWREATIGAAETAADFSVMLKTAFQPDQMDTVAPMSTLDIQKRMMTALPNGWDAHQMRSEHPNATYETFNRSLINEQARPRSMPYNKAACDSADYNYASGRLDHQTYYESLDGDRDDCDDLVLDKIFAAWFEFAVVTYGWLGGNPDALSPAASSHLWDWPKHRVADIKTEAQATDTKLKNGTASLSSVFSEAGEDYEDEVLKQAAANGVTPEQQKQINMLVNVPQHAIAIVAQLIGVQVPQGQSQSSATPVADDGGDSAPTRRKERTAQRSSG